MSVKTEVIGGKNNSKKGKKLATDYVKESGLKNGVNFKDGKVYVFGREMKDFYVDGENKAHVDTEEMDKAISDAKESMGIKENAYEKKISYALSDIEDNGDWSYVPDQDPAYIAYRDQYMREGQRAYDDAYAQMTSLTGGYESSAAITAGAQQLNYYNEKLSDKIPELMENSYDRYQDDLERKYNYLGSLIDLDKVQTEKNNYIYDHYNDAADADMERTLYEAYTRHKNELDLEKDRVEIEKDKVETEKEKMGLDVLEDQEDLLTKQIKNAIQSASVRGYFTDEEAELLGLKKGSDGEYPSPFSGEVQREIEMWNSIGKTKEQFKTNEAIRKAWAT